ncbi:MAG: beta-glucosidase BglX [Bacteroidales bacterium]|nr:beta-glucosidase BglX [Bacteroidales bacterium]
MRQLVMNRVFPLVFALAVILTSCGDKTSEKDKYINELMGKMTLREKLGQMNLPMWDSTTMTDSFLMSRAKDGSIGGLWNFNGDADAKHIQTIITGNSRLGIPILFGADVNHGHRTVFPIGLAMSCSWDMEAIEKAARISATEAAADGICWTYSPTVDICHDPRWGRIAEAAGEDPYLGARVAEAMVHGYQGNLRDSTEIMSCVKHFAFYGAPDGGRDYNTVEIGRNRMYNEYLEPYKAAIEAGAGTVMTSYNTVDGIPSTGNRWVLTELLRKELGFKGMVVSDANAISCMVTHGIGELKESSVLAIKAGTDMDMNSLGYIGTLEESIKEGKVSIKEIDNACRRILSVKYDLGILKDPFKYLRVTEEDKEARRAAHLSFEREMAAKSMVLLKNEGGLLPLEKKGTIAVIGPLADSWPTGEGTWTSGHRFNQNKIATLYQGLEEELGDKVNLLYARGCSLYDDEVISRHVGEDQFRDNRSDEEMLREAVSVARRADVVIAALGENNHMSGEGACRSDLNLPASQRRLLETLLSTGKDVVMLNYSGRPTVLTWENAHVPAILQVWFGGSEEAKAVSDILFGEVNPSGRLSVSFPYNGGQIPYYYNHLRTGDPFEKDWETEFQMMLSNYFDTPNDPLYPFGYGLSYTTFQYGEVSIDDPVLRKGGEVTVAVKITNTGDRDGDETPQLYIHDLMASVARPMMELKGFQKIHLKAGESVTARFSITEETLSFYDSSLKKVSEPGDFDIMIGPDCAHVQSVRLTLKD